MKPLNRLTLYAFIFAVAFAALVPVADAGCRQFVRSYHHVQAVKVVQPLVVYKAGADIEAEALAEKVARLVTQKLVAAQTLKQTAPAPQSSVVLAQKCAVCHNGTRAFDLSGGMTYEQKWRVVEIFSDGTNIPEGMETVVSKSQSDGSLPDLLDAVKALPTVQPVARTEPEPGDLQ